MDACKGIKAAFRAVERFSVLLLGRREGYGDNWFASYRSAQAYCT